MRIFLFVLLIIISGGCSAERPGATPTALIDLTLPEALAAPAQGDVALIGYLVRDDRGVVLTSGMSLAAAPPQPLAGAPQLWLGATPPPDLQLTPAGDRAFALVRVVGALDGPGSFGPDGLAYQLREPQITPLEPRATRLTALLAAASTSENQVLRISGAFLSGPGTALLVENLGPGGVPEATARQIKLIMPADDPALADRLSSGGNVRYGPVEVIGIWRSGAIHTLAIVPTSDE